MNRHKSTPEQKRKRLLFVVIVLVALFALRLILLQTGVITSPQALSEEDLTHDFTSSQVLVTVRAANGDDTGSNDEDTSLSARGTVLQISTPSGLNRQNQHKTIYILTTAGVASAAQAAEGLDNGCIITFSDGSSTQGTYVSVNEDIGAGVVSCTDEDISFAADSVFFSENILYQKENNSSCYYQPAAAADVADLSLVPVKGTYLGRDVTAEGYDIAMMACRPAEGDVMAPGSGIFSDSGYFLGMALQTQTDGKVICLAGNNAIDYFRTNH